MANPKLLDIITTLQTRLLAINGQDKFYHAVTGIFRGKRQFDIDELPAGIIAINPRTAQADKSIGRSKTNASVSIELYALINEREAETVAIELLADIQRAVELRPDYDLGELLQGHLAFENDQILYPDESGETVGVRVDYAIPHVRVYGDPTK